MEIDAQALFDVLVELYPRELQHAMSELRARRAEAQLAELQDQHSNQEQDSAVSA